MEEIPVAIQRGKPFKLSCEAINSINSGNRHLLKYS